MFFWIWVCLIAVVFIRFSSLVIKRFLSPQVGGQRPPNLAKKSVRTNALVSLQVQTRHLRHHQHQEEETMEAETQSTEIVHEGGFKLLVGACALQGRRPYMEDRRAIVESLRKPGAGSDHPPCSFFAVYDGHGGQLASSFAAANLHEFLRESKHFPHAPLDALHEACETTDRLYLEKHQSASSQDGSTACMVLLVDKTLYVANVGDSRAVLCRKGKAYPLSDDHKPDKPSEKKRIEDSGGVVKKGSFFNIPMGPFRVYQGDGMRGGLAVSRALGDTFYKDPKRPPSEWLVSGTPEIKEEPLTPGEDEFFIVASDGFWDVFSNDNAIFLTKEMLQNKDLSIADVSQALATKAFARESLDNITVVVVHIVSNGETRSSEKSNGDSSSNDKTVVVDSTSEDDVKGKQVALGPDDEPEEQTAPNDVNEVERDTNKDDEGSKRKQAKKDAEGSSKDSDDTSEPMVLEKKEFEIDTPTSLGQVATSLPSANVDGQPNVQGGGGAGSEDQSTA